MRITSDYLKTLACRRIADLGSFAACTAALWTLGCSGSSSTATGAGGEQSSVGGATSLSSSMTSVVSGGSDANGGTQSTGGVIPFGGSNGSAGDSSGVGGWQTGGAQAGGSQMGGALPTGGKANTGGRVSSGSVTGVGGTTTTGGRGAAGGTSSKGGATSTGGGASTTGGQANTGGMSAVGGSMVAGGSSTTGGTTTITTTTTTGPCDIYKAGNTTCVAAYSTVRALYGTYAGNLYQVKKTDGTTKDIGVLSPGGVADAAAQDAFCPGSGSCTISIIYDQSGNGNHLTKAPGGSTTYGPNDDVEAVADALPIKVGGHKAYGVHVVGSSSWTTPGQVGYRNTNTKNIPKGDNPESEYMVTDGTYYNGSCCFDFGNAEMQPVAGGYGTMEAIYFGSCDWWDKGAGSGPWIMADLEVGVYNWGGSSAYSDANKNGSKVNPSDISFSYPFVTAMLKGNSSKATNGGPFTLKGGNAQSSVLTTIWDGAYPVSYGSPMQRQGGIVLGVGGDNSSMAHGNFFEGVITSGYASTATDEAIQANIVAAGYSK
jgi:non-reducing end alpha-L-arabinofuranosidase